MQRTAHHFCTISWFIQAENVICGHSSGEGTRLQNGSWRVNWYGNVHGCYVTMTRDLKCLGRFYLTDKFMISKGKTICMYSMRLGNHPLQLTCTAWLASLNPYPTAFPYGNGMVLHFYQQQESSTTKTVHKVINKGLKTYV